MLNPKAFAHAVALVTAVFYIACWLVSYIAPEFIFNIAKSWIHSVNLESLRASNQMDPGTALLGLISISLLTWVTTYITIRLYNYLVKR